MDPEITLQRLRHALNETQEELRSVPWLIGALRHIASYECDTGSPYCICPSCTARKGLDNFYRRKSTV